MTAVLKRHKILTIGVLAHLGLLILAPAMSVEALKESGYYFKEMLEILPAVMILISLIQTWVPTEVIVKHFGDGSGIKGKAVSFAIGSMSAGPIYAAFPVCKMLLGKGASISNVIIILSAWAVVKVPMLINEVKFMGPKYMVLRWIFSAIAILAMAWIMDVWVKQEDLELSDDNAYLTIDQKKCAGCGICIARYPEIVELQHGAARFIGDPSKLPQDIQEGIARICPFNAIAS